MLNDSSAPPAMTGAAPTTASPVTAGKRAAPHPALLGLLALSVVGGVWSLTRARTPAAPPATAPLAAQRAFYQERVRADVSDVNAYLRLGVIEEKDGYYLSARKSLLAARALGASDGDVCGPLGRAYVGLARRDLALPELTRALTLAPHNLEAMANVVGAQLMDSDTEAARKTLGDWLRQNPTLDRPADLERVMLIASQLRDHETAAHFAARLQTAAPNNPLGFTVPAQYALSDKRYDEAASLMQKAIKAAPGQVSFYYLLGLMLEGAGKKEEALAAYEKCFNDPNALDAWEKASDLLARQGDFKRASDGLIFLALHAPALDTASSASAACEKAGRKNDALYWRAVALGFQRRYKDALATARQAAQSADPEEKKRALGAIAEAYRGLGDQKAYFAALDAWTSDGTYDDLLTRAAGYERTGRYDDRARTLEQALKLDPSKKAQIEYALADNERNRQRWEAVETHLRAAIAADPKSPQYHRDLADRLWERRSEGANLPQATQEYRLATELDGSEASDWLRLGLCYQEAGQTGRALRACEHAVDLEPGYGPAYQELARLYARIGDKASSQEMIKQYQKYVVFDQQKETLTARARAPQATWRDFAAFADFAGRGGDLQTAMQWYEKAFQVNPQDKQIRARLAQVYGRLGLADRALARGIAL